jgi:hypothetical protein
MQGVSAPHGPGSEKYRGKNIDLKVEFHRAMPTLNIYSKEAKIPILIDICTVTVQRIIVKIHH